MTSTSLSWDFGANRALAGLRICLLGVLTVLLGFAPAARATLRQWTGEAANNNNNWTAPANWLAGVAVAGDDLLFMSSLPHPNCNNDYPSGTTFNSIEFRGGGSRGYNVSGSSIALNAGIQVENNSGNHIDHTVNNSLILNSNQTFRINNSAGIFIQAGPIDLNGKELTFDITEASPAEAQGVINGAAGLLKIGKGMLTIAGNNTYTGATTLDEGTLQINGVQPGSAIVLIAGTLKGVGLLGPVTSIGNGGPGSIVLSPGGSAGVLTCHSVALNPSTTLAVELNGTTIGSGYDQLKVNDSVSLNNAALSVTLGFTAAVGNSFVILNKLTPGAISGTFSDFLEGTFFTNSGAVFRISYTGGDGNDVVLSRVNPPARFTSITNLANNTVRLEAAGAANLTYTIQANTNLTTTNWMVIGTAPSDGNGVFSFTDMDAPLFRERFYRALSP